MTISANNSDGSATWGYASSPTVTRPANQTPYTGGDVVGGAIEFTNMGPPGSVIVLLQAALDINIAAIPSGMTSFRLYLYTVTPPSALADNAAWTLLTGDRAAFAHNYIDLGSPAAVGGTLNVPADQINKTIKLAAASTSLFGYLVTNGGFTPAANSEVYVPTLLSVAV